MKEKRNSYLISKAATNFLVASVLTMAVQQLNVIIDGIIISHFVGPDALASVNLYQPISLAVMSLCSLFGIGATIRAAKAIGERDTVKLEGILSTAIASVVCIGVFIAVLGNLFGNTIVLLITDDERLMTYFSDYMQIMVTFSMITMLNAVYNQIVSINGYPRMVSLAVVLSTVFNLLLDILFVGVLDMGIGGSAWATIIAVSISTLFLCYKLEKIRSFSLNPLLKFSFSNLRGNMLQGLPLIVSNLVLMVMFWMLNTIVQDKQGADGMFALAICTNLLALGMMFSSGIGSAVMSIGGFLVGQHDMEGVRILVNKSVKILLICLAVVVSVIELFPGLVSGLFGASTPELMEYSNYCLRIFVLMLPTILLVLMLANVYQMLGFLILTPVIILTFPLVLIPSLYAWSEWGGKEFIWWAFPTTGVLVLLLAFVITECIRWKKRSLSVLTMVPMDNIGQSLARSVKASREGVIRVIPDIISFLEHLKLERSKSQSICLCIEEIMLNICNHGGKNIADHYFDVHICYYEEKINVSIKDDGVPFNPMIVKKEDRHLGLNLVHGFCEKMEYKYMYGQNMVFMTWTINLDNKQ